MEPVETRVSPDNYRGKRWLAVSERISSWDNGNGGKLSTVGVSGNRNQKQRPEWPNLVLQPDSRPISEEQLFSEMKSIYAGLTMVETKCIHVDRA